jgi:hypothetical protein
MQQGMLLCHSWGEEESLRARHKTVLFTKLCHSVFFCVTLKVYAKNKRKTLLLRPTLHTLGVKANNVQLKSSIPIGAKVEIGLMGFYTRSQG